MSKPLSINSHPRPGVLTPSLIRNKNAKTKTLYENKFSKKLEIVTFERLKSLISRYAVNLNFGTRLVRDA